MSHPDPDIGWKNLRERLRRVVRLRGVDRTADDIPADRSTVLRVLSQAEGATRFTRTTLPSYAVRAGIARVVEEWERREADWTGSGRTCDRSQ